MNVFRLKILWCKAAASYILSRHSSFRVVFFFFCGCVFFSVLFFQKNLTKHIYKPCQHTRPAQASFQNCFLAIRQRTRPDQAFVTICCRESPKRLCQSWTTSTGPNWSITSRLTTLTRRQTPITAQRPPTQTAPHPPNTHLRIASRFRWAPSALSRVWCLKSRWLISAWSNQSTNLFYPPLLNFPAFRTRV